MDKLPQQEECEKMRKDEERRKKFLGLIHETNREKDINELAELLEVVSNDREAFKNILEGESLQRMVERLKRDAPIGFELSELQPKIYLLEQKISTGCYSEEGGKAILEAREDLLNGIDVKIEKILDLEESEEDLEIDVTKIIKK